MIDPASVPDVGDNETLARYVLQRSHIRRSDRTVKPDAFMPPPDLQLSATRHRMATEAEIWEIGESVAAARILTLYGRGDFSVTACIDQRLGVSAAPVVGNPNHAHVLKWPDDKAGQKSIAQEIAASATFVPKP
jgi:hypothetical protein